MGNEGKIIYHSLLRYEDETWLHQAIYRQVSNHCIKSEKDYQHSDDKEETVFARHQDTF